MFSVTRRHTLDSDSDSEADFGSPNPYSVYTSNGRTVIAGPSHKPGGRKRTKPWPKDTRSGPTKHSYDVEKIETYLKPSSTIRQFNDHFPLPKRLFKQWSDGVRIWFPPKVVSKPRVVRKFTGAERAQISKMLKAGIIQPALNNRSPLVSTFFLVDRPNKKYRPITNFSQLSRLVKPPAFRLPNIFQLADRTVVKKGAIWFTSIDVKQAFYNIPVHPKSKFVTTFRVGEDLYFYNVLPFGIGIALFVCQTFTRDSFTIRRALL